MKPINFEGSNIKYTKPESWDDEDCGDLPAYKANDKKLGPFIMSCWELSDEELQDIIKSKRVWLNIHSSVMIPVSISVVSLTKEEI